MPRRRRPAELEQDRSAAAGRASGSTGHFEIHIYSSELVQTVVPGPYDAWRVTYIYTGSIESGVQVFTWAACANVT